MSDPKSWSNYHFLYSKLKLNTLFFTDWFNIHIIFVPLGTGIRTANDVAEQLKAIRGTNVINDDIVRKYFLFSTKDAKKKLQKGYNTTIIFGKRIKGSADNALLLEKFHGITSNNDVFGKSFLKEIIGSYLKFGQRSLRLRGKVDQVAWQKIPYMTIYLDSWTSTESLLQYRCLDSKL